MYALDDRVVSQVGNIASPLHGSGRRRGDERPRLSGDGWAVGLGGGAHIAHVTARGRQMRWLHQHVVTGGRYTPARLLQCNGRCNGTAVDLLGGRGGHAHAHRARRIHVIEIKQPPHAGYPATALPDQAGRRTVWQPPRRPRPYIYNPATPHRASRLFSSTSFSPSSISNCNQLASHTISIEA